jgi:hypothetical protein
MPASTPPGNQGPNVSSILLAKSMDDLIKAIQGLQTSINAKGSSRIPGTNSPALPKQKKTHQWNRKQRGAPTLGSGFAKKAGAYARLKFGRGTGKAVQAGIGSAGKSLQMGWPVGMAARSGVASAATSALGAGGALGAATGVGVAFVAVAAAVWKAIDSVKAMTEEQVNYAKHLSQASGMMAAVVANRDVKEMMRDMEKGNRLSGSMNELFDAEQERKDNTKDIEILGEKIKNGLLTFSNNVISGLAKPFNELAAAINKKLGDEEEKPDLTSSEWAEQMLAETRAHQRNHKPDWE